jgi:two-component system KDP operon response regulator KdpE
MNINNQEPEKNTKACVLVVDDDAKILRFVGLSLRLASYHVLTTSSGEEALKLSKTESVDIMLVDILMPVMDGFEVLRRLRTASKLPVIAISAHTSTSQKAHELGANDFLAKPFRPEDLVRRIDAILCRNSGQAV